MTTIMKKIWQHEIVHVLTPAFLVNSARQACRYETADGGRMAPGYYLALCASGVSRSSYGRGGRFFGPFTTLAEARFLQTSAAALGIIDMAVPVPAAPAHGFDDRRSYAVRGEVFGVLPEQRLVRGASTGFTGFFNSSNDPDRRRAGRKGSATRSTDSIGRASQQSC